VADAGATDRPQLRDGTTVVRAGLPEPVRGEPLLPGPSLASAFHLPGDPADSPYAYGRYSTPSWARYEQALGELEGGEACVFASGMAAVAAVLLPALAPGDVLVVPADGYPPTRELAAAHLAPRGVEVRRVPTAGDELLAAIEGADLVWVETPSNPGLDVCDLRAVCAAARDAGALVGVDNTFASPLGQRPLELGADFSVCADTKHLAGHSDLVLGHVAVRDPARAEGLRSWRTVAGAVPGPFETWLAHRSLATLGLRLDRQCATALAVAELLAARPDVRSVRYPGRPGDPAHPVARRQMRRFGTVVSFDLESAERAQRFLSACRLVDEATSFGGVHSLAERRARWPGNDVPPGLVRLSLGVEDPRDLLADVAAALDGSR
jgi:cystathionine gamma-lyase